MAFSHKAIENMNTQAVYDKVEAEAPVAKDSAAYDKQHDRKKNAAKASEADLSGTPAARQRGALAMCEANSPFGARGLTPSPLLCPSSIRRLVRCEPINPAPPSMSMDFSEFIN